MPSPPPGWRPDYKLDVRPEHERNECEQRIELMTERYEQGLDICTGEEMYATAPDSQTCDMGSNPVQGNYQFQEGTT